MTRSHYDRRSDPFQHRNPPLVERNLRFRGDDEQGPAPCPRCGKAMVARLGRKGPYFHCLCVDKDNPKRR